MKHYHIIFTVRIFSETCRGPVARLLLRRPHSLQSGRVVVVVMAVLAEVVVVVLAKVVVVMAEVVVLAEVLLLDDSVHVAIVPCLSYSYFCHVSCLALLLCS